MLRVLGTMKNSPYSKSFKNQISDLGQWTFDIQKAMYPHLVRCLSSSLHSHLLLPPPRRIPCVLAAEALILHCGAGLTHSLVYVAIE